MWFPSLLLSLLLSRKRRSQGRRPGPFRPRRPLLLEPLEDRLCPSGGYLFVNSYSTNSILRYDETTGAFVDEFVKHNAGGLYSPTQIDFGPDHNLYAGNGLFSFNNQANDVLRFDGTTGASLGVFADGGQLTDTRGVIFGHDGNLYVGDGNGPGRVLRYDGTTGAFLDTFVPLGSGGLSHPATCMLFGPDGNLYVIAADKSEVLRYDGRTGAFLGTFVPSGSNGLSIPISMAFGPDGNLYVANTRLHDDTGGGILRFEGPAGPNPGAFLGTFVAAGSGGLDHPLSVIFGPGGNLYAGSAGFKVGDYSARPHTSEVLRYDGTTGAFLGTFVAPDSGGLRFPQTLLFSQTDPVTLNFDGTEGDSASRAASLTTPLQPVSSGTSAGSDAVMALAVSPPGGMALDALLVGAALAASQPAASPPAGGAADLAPGHEPALPAGAQVPDPAAGGGRGTSAVVSSSSVGPGLDAGAVDRVFGADGDPWFDPFADALVLAHAG
jgi:sugar lactone lactonase YvrE